MEEPPKLAQKISASIIDIGLKSKRKDNSTVTAAKNKITVIESINIERTADNNIKAINIGITLYFTAFASLIHNHLKKPTLAIPSTITIIPAMKNIVAQSIPLELK